VALGLERLTVLGIETSCDETAAAVVSSDGHVFSDVIESQVASARAVWRHRARTCFAGPFA
jgi:hypothetical protein